MYTVYVLKSLIARKSYVGMTSDVVRRLGEHNSGRHTYTKRYLPWEIFYTEKYQTLGEASKRERYFKSASGRRLLKKLFADKYCGIV